MGAPAGAISDGTSFPLLLQRVKGVDKADGIFQCNFYFFRQSKMSEREKRQRTAFELHAAGEKPLVSGSNHFFRTIKELFFPQKARVRLCVCFGREKKSCTFSVSFEVSVKKGYWRLLHLRT